MFKTLTKKIYLLALYLVTVSVHAAAAQDLSTLLDGIHSMRAGFTQTVYDNHGKAIQHSYGKMAMQRPGKFRWDVTRPIPQLVVANGSRLWIYDPDLQQVTIRTLKMAAGETPALLLSNVNTTVNQDFTVTESDLKMPGWDWFKLVPKKADNMFEAVEMGFQNKHFLEMRLKDNLGHTTRIQYQNAEFNVNLSSSLFSFNPPKGVDVINETRQK